MRRPTLLIVGCGDIGLRVLRLLRPRWRVLALSSSPARAPLLRDAGAVPLLGNLDECGTLGRLAGLADHVLEEAGRANYEFLHMEGYQNGAWILLDFNDVVVNIFQKDARLLYNIEGLWSGVKPLLDERGEADDD